MPEIELMADPKIRTYEKSSWPQNKNRAGGSIESSLEPYNQYESAAREAGQESLLQFCKKKFSNF